MSKNWTSAKAGFHRTQQYLTDGRADSADILTKVDEEMEQRVLRTTSGVGFRQTQQLAQIAQELFVLRTNDDPQYVNKEPNN